MTAPAISESQTILAQASDRLVRDLLDRELIIQQLRAMKDADAQTMESLQRDLAERERKVETLTGKKEHRKKFERYRYRAVSTKAIDGSRQENRGIDEPTGGIEAHRPGNAG